MKLTPVVVGSRGRIVLPREAREALGVAEGDTLFCIVQGDLVRLVRTPSDFGAYLGLLSGSGDSAAEDAVEA